MKVKTKHYSLNKSIPYLIYRITARLNQEIHDRLRPTSITLSRWRILSSLKSRGKSTITELASCTLMKHAVLSRVLKEMEDDNLIRRMPCNRDLRAVQVDLTRKGLSAFDEAYEIAKVHRDIALKGISPADTRTLLKLLRQIQKNLNISQ